MKRNASSRLVDADGRFHRFRGEVRILFDLRGGPAPSGSPP